MAKKIKLSEAAKDLNIPAQELIGYFTEKGDTKKKTASTLTEEEMNEILEHYTKLHEVKNLDEYFATANEPRPEKKKTAAEAAPKSQEKKPAAKKNEKAEKPAAKADKKDAAPKKTAPEKPVAKKATAPAAKPAVKEEKPAVRTEAPAPKAEAAKKPAETPKSSEPQKHNGKKNEKKQQAKAHDRGERSKFNASFSSETAQTSGQRRTVDTRGSYVDLDKYNERYDQMASSNKHNSDNYSSKKQKINQKSAQRNRQQYSKKETEAEKLRRLELERARNQQLKVLIPEAITVGELATRLKATATDVIKKLMGLGVMASINQEIDFDTASLVAEELGAKVEKEVIVTIEERLIDDTDDDDTNLEPRCPVVVVMISIFPTPACYVQALFHGNNKVQALSAQYFCLLWLI